MKSGDDVGTEVIIRPVVESDWSAIIEIFREFVSFHAQRDPHFKKVDGHGEMFADYVRENLRTSNAIMLVAVIQDLVVGYCFALIQRKPPVYSEGVYGYIDNLAVLNSYQRRGIGSLLYGHVLNWFKTRNIVRIELAAAITNEKSTSFWRKMGFKPFMETLFTKI